MLVLVMDAGGVCGNRALRQARARREFRSTCVGNDTPVAMAALVKNLAAICVAPVSANMLWGSPAVSPAANAPAAPTATFSAHSTTSRKVVNWNVLPSSAAYL